MKSSSDQPSPAHRTYRQTRRAQTAAETRAAILEAARAELVATPLRPLNVADAAKAAGVSRSTIYEVFGDRPGLYAAVAEDVLRRGGFDRLVRATQDPDAYRALVESLRAAARLMAGEHAVGGAILSLAAVDPDAAEGAARLNEGRLGGMEHLARRLREQGYLRDDVPHDEAVDLLWVVTGPETFRQLHAERGLGWRAAANRLVAMATRTLCDPKAVAGTAL
jgi:AcrR family transcriptional regulator